MSIWNKKNQNQEHPQQSLTLKLDLKKVIKKDRIFILVLVITVGGLVYHLMSTIYGLMNTINKTANYNIFYLCTLILVDILAIIGVLWLLRSYRRTLRALKKQQQDMIARMEQDKKDKEQSERGEFNE